MPLDEFAGQGEFLGARLREGVTRPELVELADQLVLNGPGVAQLLHAYRAERLLDKGGRALAVGLTAGTQQRPRGEVELDGAFGVLLPLRRANHVGLFQERNGGPKLSSGVGQISLAGTGNSLARLA